MDGGALASFGDALHHRQQGWLVEIERPEVGGGRLAVLEIGLLECRLLVLEHTVAEDLEGVDPHMGRSRLTGESGGVDDGRLGELRRVDGVHQAQPQRQLALLVELHQGCSGLLGGDRVAEIHRRREAVLREPREDPGQRALNVGCGDDLGGTNHRHRGWTALDRACGVAGAVAHVFTARGVGGVFGDTGQLQRLAVGPHRVNGVIGQHHRPVGHHGVEPFALGTGFAEQQAVVGRTKDRRLAGVGVGVGLELALNACQGVGHRQGDATGGGRAHQHVDVGLDEPRQQQLALQVNGAAALADVGPRALVAAHIDDLVAAYGHGLGPGLLGVDGVDAAVEQHGGGGLGDGFAVHQLVHLTGRDQPKGCHQCHRTSGCAP